MYVSECVCVCVSMSVSVTLPVGTVFLYLNNNRSSPNFTEMFLSITSSDVFFIFLKVESFLRFLTYKIILSKDFW